MWHAFLAWCDMVKIGHTVFALPFAYAAAFLAGGGRPGFWKLFTLTCALFLVRSFAMTVNRLVDLPYDRKNPRTRNRPLVTGSLSIRFAQWFAGSTALFFVFACAVLNPVCLALSPVALLICLAYSYTKRVTALCHFVLGAALALAPLAGWLSVRPVFSLAPFLLALAVLLWVAGFDIIYACQDTEFDRAEGLRSIPASLGEKRALALARVCHAGMLLVLVCTGMACDLSIGWYFGLSIIAGILLGQHMLVLGPSQAIAKAFALNGPVSIALFISTLMGIYVQ